uniref:Transmembrane protein n=1 Tax=Rhipicephalus zambeziensis TaxID=60191 RepID=A0A224Y7B4_9ACAR
MAETFSKPRTIYTFDKIQCRKEGREVGWWTEFLTEHSPVGNFFFFFLMSTGNATYPTLLVLTCIFTILPLWGSVLLYADVSFHRFPSSFRLESARSFSSPFAVVCASLPSLPHLSGISEGLSCVSVFSFFSLSLLFVKVSPIYFGTTLRLSLSLESAEVSHTAPISLYFFFLFNCIFVKKKVSFVSHPSSALQFASEIITFVLFVFVSRKFRTATPMVVLQFYLVYDFSVFSGGKNFAKIEGNLARRGESFAFAVGILFFVCWKSGSKAASSRTARKTPRLTEKTVRQAPLREDGLERQRSEHFLHVGHPSCEADENRTPV